MKAIKWLFSTVLIGATPLIFRFVIFLFVPDLTIGFIFNEIDMVTFGLVLHVSNINELEDRTDMAAHTKTVYIGLSTFLIVLFGVLLGIAYIADLDKINLFDKLQIKRCTGLLSLVSLFFSYSIYRRQVSVENG